MCFIARPKAWDSEPDTKPFELHPTEDLTAEDLKQANEPKPVDQFIDQPDISDLPAEDNSEPSIEEMLARIFDEPSEDYDPDEELAELLEDEADENEAREYDHAV